MNVEGIVHDEVDRKILSVIFSLEMQVLVMLIVLLLL